MGRVPTRNHRFKVFVLSMTTLIVIATALPGCGGPSGVVEGDISDEARKALVQKKVDVQQRPSLRTRSKAVDRPKSVSQGR